MSKTYKKLQIDVNKDVTDIITAVQNDSNSRYLDVVILDGSEPFNFTDENVKIYMKKPDGTEIFNNGVVTEAANGRCQFELTSQALANVGVLKTQISIWKNNTEILSTKTFNIFVTESLVSSSSIESSNEYGALVVLFQNLYESMGLMTDMVNNFGKAGSIAESIPATTFWEMLETLYSVNKEALKNASVSEILNRLGVTTDTGGSDTTGTVMAKLNKLNTYVELIKKRQAVYTPNGSKTFALATPSTAPKFTINASTKENHFLTGTPFKCKFNGYLYIDIDLYLTVDSTAQSSQLRVWILRARGSQNYTADSPMATTHYQEFCNMPNGTTVVNTGKTEPTLYDKVELIGDFNSTSEIPKGVKTHLTGFKYIKVSKGDVIRITLSSTYPPCTVEDINIKLKYDEYEGD